MSDALGDKHPTTGDPIEDAAPQDESAAPAEQTESAEPPAAPAEIAPDAVEPTAADQTSAGPVAGDLAAESEPVAEPAPAQVPPSAEDPEGSAESPASTAPEAAAEPTADAAATERIPSRADQPAADAAPDATPEAASEPDYAALAAELEEFEARSSGTTPVATPTAPTQAVGHAWFEEAPETFRATEPGDDAPTQAMDPVPPAVVPSEPVQRQPDAVIVEEYEPPRKRGNRLAALLIGIPATIVFVLLYAAADLGWKLIQGEIAFDTLASDLLATIAEASFWLPAIVFFLAFWIVGLLVNRGRAAWWVVLGLLVAAATYAGCVFADVVTYPFWMIAPSEAQAMIGERLLDPVAIVSFVIAREVTVWFGAWVAGRGRRMKRLNAEDRAEYERAVSEGE
ncbi:MAG: hypothetical protein ACTHZX_12910 [Microbacterium sp.]